MSTYNKLVRDKIPEIISEKGDKANFRILDEDEYILALNAKLSEECAEYQKGNNVEELADILEVIYAIVKAKGWSAPELEEIRAHKAKERGGFVDRNFLIDAESTKEQ